VTDTSAARQSVYQRVLGDDFAQLAPELQAYFSLPPEGLVGRGSGTYDVAGSEQRWLVPLLRLMAWRRILFPEWGRGIRFDITNVPGPGDGLSAHRETHFDGVTRIMEDTMHVIDGRLHDFLGRRRGLEARFTLTVRSGVLRMVSDKTWLHLWGLRVPIPALFSARVIITERWDGDAQRVDAKLRNPLFGVVFRYGGRFSYGYEPL